MKRLFQIFLLLTITLMLQSCAGTQKKATKKLVIEIETTACYGTCPVYRIQIFNDRTAIYEGREHLTNLGNYRVKLDAETYNNLIRSFDEIDFFNLKDSYKSRYKDLPTKYISYNKDGKSKRIMAYDNIPEELTQLINQLKSLIDTEDWKGIK